VSAAPLTLRPVAPADLGGCCAICQTDFQPGEQIGPCPACQAPFHGDCWDENGGCAAYGCRLVPLVTAAPAAPPSVWGQEERDCPACGARIKMAALRCLHCGRPVPPARGPEAAAAAQAVVASPGVGGAALLFAAGILPPTAPLALLGGGLWLWRRRRELRRWPPTVRVLVIAALAAAAAVTLVTLIGLAVHGARTEE
jgi:RING finger family protein